MKTEKETLDEIQRIDREIAKFKIRCQSCHKETSSADLTGFCFECPRCLRNDRECLNEGDHCSVDHSHDCVCTRIKHTFLNNVFENMYTVLERQVQTCSGKELADCILNSLKTSRNGKLNAETRSILQDFILNTVRQNLNLTIVGGAVKTRCEVRNRVRTFDINREFFFLEGNSLAAQLRNEFCELNRYTISAA